MATAFLTFGLLEGAGLLLAILAVRALTASPGVHHEKPLPVELPSRGRGSWSGTNYSIALSLIVVIGAVLHATYLSQPMRGDEATTYMLFASHTIRDGLSSYSQPNNHLLHTLLVHVSTAALGNAEWMIRLPAYVFGVCIIPATYWLANTLSGRNTAIFAAAAVASSMPFTLYSTNARGYTLLSTISLLIFGLIASPSGGGDPRRRWILLGVLGALGMWTVPTMLYQLLGASAWLVVCSRTRTGWAANLTWRDATASAMLAAGLTICLYAPIISRVGVSVLVANIFVVPHPLSWFLAFLPRFIRDLRDSWTSGLPPWSLGLFGVGLIAAFTGPKSDSRRPLGLAAATIVPAIALFLAMRAALWPRVWLYLLPVILIVASVGLGRMSAAIASRLGVSAPLSSCVAAVSLAVALSLHVVRSGSVLSSGETGTFRNAAELANILRSDRRPNDFVVDGGHWDMPLAYYALRGGTPPDILFARPTAIGRLLIVVDEAGGQTVKSALARTRVVPDCSIPPRVLYQLSEASLVELSVRRVPDEPLSDENRQGCDVRLR